MQVFLNRLTFFLLTSYPMVSFLTCFDFRIWLIIGLFVNANIRQFSHTIEATSDKALPIIKKILSSFPERSHGCDRSTDGAIRARGGDAGPRGGGGAAVRRGCPAAQQHARRAA